MNPTPTSDGLEARYSVHRLKEDPEGKHAACRYFVLDPQHDLIAREALAEYAHLAREKGFEPLAVDLLTWLDALNTGP